jgi:hypothetical protein
MSEPCRLSDMNIVWELEVSEMEEVFAERKVEKVTSGGPDRGQ